MAESDAEAILNGILNGTGSFVLEQYVNERIIETLEGRNPRRTIGNPYHSEQYPVCLGFIDNNALIERFSRAIVGSGEGRPRGLQFAFNYEEDGNLLPVLNWDPLLEAIATRKTLEFFLIRQVPTGRLLPLFNSLFPALQRNSSLCTLFLESMDLSDNNNHTNLIVSYLDASSTLENLTFVSCTGDDAGSITAALRRNRNLRCLHLHGCNGIFARQIVQKILAPLEGPSQLNTLGLAGGSLSAPVQEALQQCLQSTTDSPIECLKLCGSITSEFASFLLAHFHGELELNYCNININPGNNAEHVANPFRSKTNLRSLRISSGNLFQHQQFVAALANVLVHPESPLRSLYLNVNRDAFYHGESFPFAEFRTLAKAASNSSRLESISIGTFELDLYGHTEAASSAIRSKVETITLRVSSGDDDRSCGVSFADVARILHVEAELMENYHVQTFYCSFNGGEPFVDRRFWPYLRRNQRLARWDENPDLVPRESLAEALSLAREACFVSLFQSLVIRLAKEVLEGEAARLAQQQGSGKRKRRRRKRKRLQD